MNSLRLIKFKVHLDNGYGKPVCSDSAPGKHVKLGDELYNCEECYSKFKTAKEKQEQIDELNSLEQDIHKQLYISPNKPRDLVLDKKTELSKQLVSVERKRKAIISTVNTVESEIMAHLSAHKYFDQKPGVAI